jgi:cyclic pyranopterin phosphate synthase
MVIGPTFLVEKTGGVSSNDYKRQVNQTDRD